MKQKNLIFLPNGNWTRMLSSLVLLMVLMTGMAFAQKKAITGAVTDQTGSPIPGVTVIVKGTSIGVVTDFDGKYTLSVPADAKVLNFSFVGMVPQDIEIAGKTTINTMMKSDVVGVEEVVVVGYGTQQKKTLTGAVATVGDSELRGTPSANAASRMQGRVAGVTITTDNSPGGDATVRVRGIGSVNNNDPLYIIDGVPSAGGMTSLNSNDIETMTVLKDASSSAIYGVRAANGVIIVTTKRGSAGKTKISFDARYGIQSNTNQLKLMNTQQYGDMTWLEFTNAGLKQGDAGWTSQQYGSGATPVIPDYIFPTGVSGTIDESKYSYPSPYNGITKANKTGTNWSNEIFHPAPIQEYNLAMSGGSEKGNYAFSAGYMKQDGVLKMTDYERFSLRSNADAKIGDWLQVGESIGATYSDRVLGFTNNDEGNPISQLYRMQPIVPVYDIKGNFAGTQAKGTGNGANPLANLVRNKDDYQRDLRILGTAYAQVDFMKNFSLKTLFGADYISSRIQDRNLRNPEFAEAIAADALSQTYNGTLQWNWSNTLNFKKKFADVHNVNVLVGSEAVSYNYDNLVGSRSTYAFTNTDYMILNSGEASQASSGYFDESKTFSYFGRLNYDYKGKYLLEGVVRRDASSRFNKANRWGTFPAFSAGWRVSEEAFMQNVTWINDLKLRAGWGKTGNDNVGGYYNSYSTYRASVDESFYSMSGSAAKTDAGFHKYKLGNPDGKWEANATTNLGIDATFLGKSLEVNLDLYQKVTTDMLYNQQLPSTWGYLVLPAVNIGEMKNTGLDLMVTYHGKVGNDFKFDVRGNISHYKNEVVKLNTNPNEKLYGPQLRQIDYTVSMAGQPISSFYGYVVEGIFNTPAEVAAHPKYNPDINGNDSYSKPGVFMYKDVNGDGKITSDDRTIIGSPHPDFTYGLNIDFAYKNFDMTMFFQGSQGNDLINYVNRWTKFNNFSGNRDVTRLTESWTAERYANGSKITMPMAILDDAVMQQNSTFFVEDGSYLRMKNLQIGYSLPAALTSRLKIDHLRIYVQATNLFTITKYSGLDPEIRMTQSNADRGMGIDEGVYPTSQIFMVGINLNL
ncbi:MAG TPA: TonB-dependent receptor [Prolixibacteraceae bacterium]|nr:TonB-dependent receptor [Prolixibacteraceae bacterium]